jgi:hypothetical protein
MMSRVRRRLVCFLWDHRWQRSYYPDADSEDGYFLRCARCGKERDSGGGPGRFGNAIAWGANH